VLDADDIATRMPPWLRIALVGLFVVVATAAGLFAYRYYMQPTTLTIAVGSSDGEGPRLLAAIAGRLASAKTDIRLKVVDAGSVLEAAKAFASGRADLAVVRADAGDLSAARTVVLVTHMVALMIAPPGSSLDSMDDLKGKMVGVINGDINRRIVELLTKEYDLARAKVQFKELTPTQAQAALNAKQVSALLVVVPLSEKYLSLLRDLFQVSGKRKPTLIPIGSAAAIANIAPAYESFDVPKGTLRGAPPIPEDDTTTLRVPVYLVANKKLDDDVVSELTKAIMETRRELVGEYPLLAQIMAPSTDKDAFIPVHPGAAAFFDGTQQDFFDKYSNALYYGPMLLGGLASLLAALWKFMGVGTRQRKENRLEPLYALAGAIREARSEADLVAIEEQIDDILKAELAKYTRGDLQATDAAALGLVAHRLEHLIGQRRSVLQAPPAPVASIRALP